MRHKAGVRQDYALSTSQRWKGTDHVTVLVVVAGGVGEVAEDCRMKHAGVHPPCAVAGLPTEVCLVVSAAVCLHHACQGAG